MIYKHNKAGLTLIELLLATILGSIVLISSGTLFVGMHKLHAKFLAQQHTINEIELLSRLFRDNVRGSLSILSTTSNQIEFQKDGITSKLEFIDNSLHFDRDTSTANNEIVLLQNSVISWIETNDNTNGVRYLTLNIVEQELSKTNTYTFSAAARNKS